MNKARAPIQKPASELTNVELAAVIGGLDDPDDTAGPTGSGHGGSAGPGGDPGHPGTAGPGG